MRKIFLLFLVFCSIPLMSDAQNEEPAKDNPQGAVIKFDDTRKKHWEDHFELAGIRSCMDDNIQKAYFYKASATEPVPLVVSLHTWSGDYTQRDDIAALCVEKNVNYIHPDFRGPNRTENACCSDLALSDIDDAIAYAIAHSNVDTSRIYIIGASGGGYATLCSYMRSKYSVRKFSAWVPISDLVAWYHESKIRDNKYAADILGCTSSREGLNIEVAKQKSPIYWETPGSRPEESSLFIYTGIYDGIQGSVPITHSINFYNKILSDLGVSDSSKYVSDLEKLHLLEHRRPIGNFGLISDRLIFLEKQFKSIKLTVFDGNHEMLPEYALQELLK